MARELGPGEYVGTVRVGWSGSPIDRSFTLNFGPDYEAEVWLDSGRGVWMFDVTSYEGGYEVKVLSLTLMPDRSGRGRKWKQALDEATTELFSFFLTDALS